MTEEKYTSIRLRQSIADQLKAIGRKGESYDDIITGLLQNSKKQKAIAPTEYRPGPEKRKNQDKEKETHTDQFFKMRER